MRKNQPDLNSVGDVAVSRTTPPETVRLTVAVQVRGPQFNPVLRALIENHGELNRAQAADLVNMSPAQFSRAFSTSVGKSFRTVRHQAKMLLANQYLQHTDLRVSEIAERLGYVDLKKFGRAFHLYCGMSPTRYRRLNN